MKSIYLNGNMWLKGNLHTHTTISDGAFSPEEVIANYERQNYDFLMISDHERYSNYRQIIPTTMTMIPGYEASGKKNCKLQNSIYHLLIVAKNENPCFAHHQQFRKFEDESITDVQKFIDNAIAANHLVMLCHPHWSTLEYDEILKLKGLTAVEVYNGASDRLHNVGNSIVCYDALLRNGSKMFALATDDNHNTGRREDDSYRGWIHVFAIDKSVEAITSAIIEGNYYSTTGPQIIDVRRNQLIIEIEFKGGSRVYLHEQARNGQVKNFERTLNGVARFELKGNEDYVRLEVVDEAGNTAWTNPIHLK